jgi:hypothetical protein
MSNRTDVHSPKNLVTEDYEFVGCGDHGSGSEPGYSPINTPYGQKLIADGWRFGENHSAGQCYHCGARFRYYAILKHLPTHTLIRVGETCLENRFERATSEFQRLRKQAQLDRELHRVKNLRETWFATDDDRQVAFAWASDQVHNGNYGYEGLYHKFVHGVNRYGSASDRMVRFIMRSMARDERIAAERAAQDAQKTSVVEGKGWITGEVLSVKWQENAYGGRQVMTVKDDRGFLVWGSVPARIDNVEKGDRVTFSASVEKSDRDETFGFFKRPTKASII